MGRSSIVYVERGPAFRIADGDPPMVYVEDESGGIIFRRVMSLQQFKLAIARAQEALAKWQVERLDAGSGSVVPIRRRKIRAKEH